MKSDKGRMSLCKRTSLVIVTVVAVPFWHISSGAEGRFGEQIFIPEGGYVLRQGQRLPKLVWESPQVVARIADNPTIQTRWFNRRYVEVTRADELGYYYAYGEAHSPSGSVLRRAVTCFCVDHDEGLTLLAERLMPAIQRESDPHRKRTQIASVIRSWRNSEEGALTLAGLMGTDPSTPQVRQGQWQMENASRHVQLKRKLMGLDDRPPVTVRARPFKGQPAPVLSKGSIEPADTTAEQFKQFEGLFDNWYASAKEPSAVVIARKGVIVLAKAYGEADGQAVTIDTPMLLHSTMKPLLGLQLAMYVDRGIVHWDDPIGDHLWDFNSVEDRRLTFRAGHVHVSGIHFPWELAFSRLFYFRTWQDSMIAHCPREWPPGAKQRYGVVGIILAVRALELMSGKNYWHAMEEELFAPLGIKNILPGGTGFSAENLARIGVLLANHGKYGNWEFFSEETYQSMLPTSLEPYFPAVKTGWGIGLRNTEASLGPGSYGHGGGCGTQLLVNPEKHLVFAMVRNERGKHYKEHLEEVLTWLMAWING